MNIQTFLNTEGDQRKAGIRLIKVLVTGDRDWKKWEPIVAALESLSDVLGVPPEEILIIHGDCRVADRMAAVVAEALGMTLDKNPAHWQQYKKG